MNWFGSLYNPAVHEKFVKAIADAPVIAGAVEVHTCPLWPENTVGVIDGKLVLSQDLTDESRELTQLSVENN